MAKLLIIDDDSMICETMSRIFSDMGHDVATAPTIGDGLIAVESGDFDVVFLDVRLPDGNGLKYIPVIQALPPCPEVIIVTGYADPDGAELAIKNNAWDYIKKPSSIDTMTLTLNRALQYRREKSASPPLVNLKRDGIVGESPEIMECLDLVARAANSNANILVAGETGTGKELFSRAIHANSSRTGNEFVAVDCGSLPETLFESLLFGHTRGAFTGAEKAETGLVKHADGGTLFLDEVGELSMTAQKSLLRVLQERRFKPIGSTREIESDFRLVAATNKDLDERVGAGKFREDLLFRLKSVTISLPPLRKRADDINDLALHFMRSLCEARKIGTKGFSPEFVQIFKSYNWPGNIRELSNTLEWAITQAFHEPTLYPKHLPAHIRIHVAKSSFGDLSMAKEPNPFGDRLSAPVTWKQYRVSLIDRGEKEYLRDMLSRTGGDIKKASELSGLSRPRFYELMRKHKLSKR